MHGRLPEVGFTAATAAAVQFGQDVHRRQLVAPSTSQLVEARRLWRRNDVLARDARWVGLLLADERDELGGVPRLHLGVARHAFELRGGQRPDEVDVIPPNLLELVDVHVQAKRREGVAERVVFLGKRAVAPLRRHSQHSARAQQFDRVVTLLI